MEKIMREVAEVQPDPGEKKQEEIRRTESEISETLHAIEQKFSLKRIARDSKRKLFDACAASCKKTVGLIKGRPVPALIVGLGTVAFFVAIRKKRTHG